MRAQLILCDAALADPSGKVSILGAGWSVTSSLTAPHAVAVLVKVPWDRTNQRVRLVVQLLDSDGDPVTLVADDGSGHPVRTEAEVEAGRPPGFAAGSHVNAAFALTVPPMPLPSGRYEWRLDTDGITTAIEEFTVLDGSAFG